MFFTKLGESSTAKDAVILMDKTKDIIQDIGRYLTDEKLYKPEQAAEVFKLEPSESFVTFLNDLLIELKQRKAKTSSKKSFMAPQTIIGENISIPIRTKKWYS